MASVETTLAERPSDSHAGAPAIAGTGPVTLLWQRLCLGLVLALAAVLDFWQLDRVGYGNTYYAAAVRSMMQNWHAFFFNSFDAQGFVTIDKPPLGFWLQVVSVKLFGFNGISLMVPQALAGVLSVAVLYHLVARTFGWVAGVLAALALAVMPVSVAANRNNIIDGTLVLVTLLGAWAVIRAAETGRLRWLLLCAFLVGLGFNVKMLEAYLVIPAFGLLYLLAAPITWPRRLGHLVLAAVVLLAISLSWSAAVDATPASQRPYVGSSSTNSEINLAFGYNGLERLTGRLFAGFRSSAPRPTATPASNGNGGNGAPQGNAGGFTRGETGYPGPWRLFNSALGGQVSWLLPLALLGLIIAAWRAGLRYPLDRRRQALLLWGAWLLVQAAFFSIAGFFHSYYMVMMAPSIAALAGIGLVTLWQEYRETLKPARTAAPAGRDSRVRRIWRGCALPVALLLTAAVQAAMLSVYPQWSGWLTPLVVGLCLAGALALVLARMLPRLGLRLAMAAVALGVAGLLSAPGAWAADTVLHGNGGMTPTAGPSPQFDFGRRPGFVLPEGPNRVGGASTARRSAFAAPRGGFDGAAVNTALTRYLEDHKGSARYLFATLNAMNAAPYIIATGEPVMALGGFSGADRIVTPSELATLVAKETVRYLFLNGGVPRSFNIESLPPQIRAAIEGPGGLPRGGFGGFGGGQNGDLVQWVSQNCAAVPSSLWQGTSPSSAGSGGFGGSGAGTPTGRGTGGGFGGFGSGGFGTGGTGGGPTSRDGFGGGFGFRGGGEQLYDCSSRPAR